jgi:hypothetical protein
VIDQLEAFTGGPAPADVEAVLAFYDTLAPVAEDELIGDWDGEVIFTGHPGEAQLDGLRWIGKTFRSRDDVDPIVVAGPDGTRQASDVLGAAALRMVEHRGVVTATMVYDNHPIFDHFRRVGDDVVLGVMDRKAEWRPPLVFVLRRRG